MDEVSRKIKKEVDTARKKAEIARRIDNAERDLKKHVRFLEQRPTGSNELAVKHAADRLDGLRRDRDKLH